MITLPKRLYQLSYSERINVIKTYCIELGLSDEEYNNLIHKGVLSEELLNTFIENSIGTFSIPLGIATNFVINSKEYLIPMAVEESSVIAAASYAAKLIKVSGGFEAECGKSIMSGQIQLLLKDNDDFERVSDILYKNKEFILSKAKEVGINLYKYGGGIVDLYWYTIPEINNLIIMIDINTAEAMGANIVNSICEGIAPVINHLTGCDVGIKILTNLNVNRLTSCRCKISFETLKTEQYDGETVAHRIYNAYLFAKYDIFRACTHNKGIMNGIDPVVIATGNDWRAIEASAHAYAVKSGKYTSLSEWSIDNENKYLIGKLELPLAIGTVGGVTKLHPTAKACLKLLGNPNSQTLSQIICSVGLAQNFAALKALATYGIQRGHMKLHKKNLDLMKNLAKQDKY